MSLEGPSVGYVDIEHLIDVLRREGLEDKESLGVRVCCPIRDSKFCDLVTLHVGLHRIFQLVVGGQWHEGIEPIHRMAMLIQPMVGEEVFVGGPFPSCLLYICCATLSRRIVNLAIKGVLSFTLNRLLSYINIHEGGSAE